MKNASTLFLKFVLILIAILTFAGLIWEPQLEGRNVNADLVQIYFQDPFLAYVYVGSIPFFAALYQASKLLGYIEQNKAFSQQAVHALQNIKYSTLTFIAALIAGIVYIRFASGEDDPAGAIAIGVCVTFASIVVANTASVFQHLVQNQVHMNSENKLTV